MKFITPIACLAGATAGGRYLPLVETELEAIRKILHSLCQSNCLDVPLLKNADSASVFELFGKNHHAIQIFHFAGHANGEQIFLETGGRAEGLSTLFSRQSNLALVFLNACNSAEQARLFLDAGVQVVIGTKARIEDGKALQFAEAFYQSLANGESVRGAFTAAKARHLSVNAPTISGKDFIEYRAGGGVFEEDEALDFAWFSFVKTGCEHHLDWRLTRETALLFRLRHGSKAHYERLTKGRYRHIQKIEKLLLSEMVGYENSNEKPEADGRVPLFGTIDIKSRPDEPFEEIPLEECLTELWNQPVPDMLLKGEGGAGKTVSILSFWEEFNKTASIGTPIPIFIPLNEYNRRKPAEQADFILDYLAKEYLLPIDNDGQFLESGVSLAPGSDERIALEMNLKIPLQKKPFKPSVILLLDGINEVVGNGLLDELGKLGSFAGGIQVVLSSRFDSRKTHSFSEKFHLVEIQPLQPDRVNAWLADKPVSTNDMNEHAQQTLLRNPMMLTLLAASSELVKQHKDNHELFDFREKIGSAGEILWNFIEAQLAKYAREDESEQRKLLVVSHLVLKQVLPFIGFEMERSGQFAFSEKELNGLLEKAFDRFEKKEFVDAFPFYRKNLADLKTEISFNNKDWDAVAEKVEKVKTWLTERLQLLIREENTFRFTHQIFRDFFAAAHLWNDLVLTLAKNATDSKTAPPTLSDRYISQPVSQFLGEIGGEPHRMATLNEAGKYVVPQAAPNLLDKMLDDLRGQFDQPAIAFAVANLLTAKSEAREKQLCGENLASLDLTKFVLNGIRFSMGAKHSLLTSANLRGTRLHSFRMLPQGHGDPIYDVVYSPDGKFALSASGDRSVREFDIDAQACIMDYREHRGAVRLVRYFTLDGQLSLMSCADDGTLKIWNRANGTCRETFTVEKTTSLAIDDSAGGLKMLLGLANGSILHFDYLTKKVVAAKVHDGEVVAVFLLADKKRVLSASMDGSAKIWNMETSDTEVIHRHDGPIRCADFHAPSGCLLTASDNQQLRLWDVKNAVSVFEETTEDFVCTSLQIHPKGTKCLATAWDYSTILEIDFKDRAFAREISGHDSAVYRVVYNPDGSQILSGSEDRTVREWDAQSGGNTLKIDSSGTRNYDLAVSPDGKRLLTAHTDKLIKEWDLEKKTCLSTLVGHGMGISAVIFNHDGTRAFSTSRDRTVRSWNLLTGENEVVGTHNINFDSVVEVPGKDWLLTGARDGVVHIWDLKTNSPVKEFRDLFAPSFVDSNGKKQRNSASKIALRPDGQAALLWALDNTLIELDLNTFSVAGVQSGKSHAMTVILYDAENRIHGITEKGKILVWINAATEPLERFATTDGATISAACFNRDFSRCLLASWSNEGYLPFKEVNIVDGLVRTFTDQHDDYVSAICYLPDKNAAVSCSYDGTIQCWDMQTGLSVYRFDNISGLFLQGCDMREVSFGLAPEHEMRAREILSTYGAKLNDGDF